MPNPVSPESLARLPVGTSVRLICRTTDANIYYYNAPNGDRRRVVPEPLQLRAIHYEVAGTVEGIEHGEFTYLVLKTYGEGAVISDVSGHDKLVGVKMKTKLTHVPLGAVVNVIRK